MFFPLVFLVLITLTASANASPLQLVKSMFAVRSAGSSNLTSLPQLDSDPAARAQAIQVKGQGYLYGPALLGGPFFPSGSLGQTLIQNDLALFAVDEGYINASINNDILLVEQAIGAVNSTLILIFCWTHFAIERRPQQPRRCDCAG